MKSYTTEAIVTRNIETYRDILVTDGKLNESALKMLVQNVERETRDAAKKSAFALANAINHGRDIEADLQRLDMLDYEAQKAGKDAA